MAIDPATPAGRLAAAAIHMHRITSFRYTVATTSTVSGQKQTVRGTGGYSKNLSTVDMDLTSTSGGPSISLVTDGSSTWMRYKNMPASALSSLGLGDGWIELAGAGGADVINSGATVITVLLDSLGRPQATAKDLGATTLDGHAVTHYTTTVDLAAPLRNIVIQHTAAKKLMQKQAESLTAVAAEVWVDDANQIAQVTYTIPITGGSAVTTVRTSDIGKPFAVVAPAGAQKMTLDQFFTTFLGPDHPGTPVDPATLPISRADFVALIKRAQPSISEGLAGCIFDELSYSPTVLAHIAASGRPASDADTKTLTQASAVCAVTQTPGG